MTGKGCRTISIGGLEGVQGATLEVSDEYFTEIESSEPKQNPETIALLNSLFNQQHFSGVGPNRGLQENVLDNEEITSLMKQLGVDPGIYLDESTGGSHSTSDRSTSWIDFSGLKNLI